MTRPWRAVWSVCDLSSQGVQAARRAAMVASEQGLALQLVLPPPQAPLLSALDASLPDRVACLTQGLVPVVTQRVAGDMLGHALRSAGERELLVVGVDSTSPAAAQAQLVRLAGASRGSVLLVRQPPVDAYRKALVAVDMRPRTASLLAAATALAPAAAIELFHALGPGEEIVLRELDASEQALRIYRQHRASAVRQALHRLIDTAKAPGRAVDTAVHVGAAAETILLRAQALAADLLVVGQQRWGLLARLLCRGVVQRVLSGARSDILLVGPR